MMHRIPSRTWRIGLPLGLILLASVPAVRAAETAAPTGPERWEGDIRRFESWDRQNAWPSDPVLFVGSSSIRMWPTREAFPHLPVLNRGFGGSHIADVNHYFRRIVAKYHPRLIVFYCGDNDIQANKTPEQVFADYQAFVQKVHGLLPKTKIIFISIKPSGARWTLWPRMQEANRMIRAFSAKRTYLVFADCGSCLCDDQGRPRDELFLKDRLHLNEKGYARWREVLEPLLVKAWGDPIRPSDGSDEKGSPT